MTMTTYNGAQHHLTGSSKRRRQDADTHFVPRRRPARNHFVTMRSRWREGRRLGVVSQHSDPVTIVFNGLFLDGQYRERPDAQDDATSLDSDRMSIITSERDYDEQMDTTEYMDLDDYTSAITERLAHLDLRDDFFEYFFANVTIDEKGRTVRRSPRLGAATGSVFVASSDGRTLRRSARTRQ